MMMGILGWGLAVSEKDRLALQSKGKPSWDDAPDWAMWLCQNFRTWRWYEARPKRDRIAWKTEYGTSTKSELASDGDENPNWKDSLEQRPDPTN